MISLYDFKNNNNNNNNSYLMMIFFSYVPMCDIIAVNASHSSYRYLLQPGRIRFFLAF